METLQPKLRFPEFVEKYINKRVDDFAPLQRGFDLPITKMVKGKFPVVFSNGISKTHNEFKVKAPGIVTGRSGTIGNLFYIEEDFWPHNTSLWVTDFKGNFPKYVYYFYDKFDLKRFGTGSGVPTLNRNDVHNQQIYIPSLEEQTRIANFLSSVDEKLNLLKEKKELLEDYKKGIMQKIFNQEIRFKDDNGNDFEDWEIYQLGSIIENIGGTSLEKFVSENGIYKFISIGNYTKNGKYYDNGQKIISNEKTETKLLNKDDLVMVLNDKTLTGDLIGSTILIDKNGTYVYNQRSERLICKSNVIPKYLWFYLNSFLFRKDVFSVSQGGTQIYVNFPNVKKLKVSLPSIKEQTKIANFLSAIDEKIELVSNQIQDTQEYKKGLLQQMFV